MFPGRVSISSGIYVYPHAMFTKYVMNRLLKGVITLELRRFSKFASPSGMVCTPSSRIPPDPRLVPGCDVRFDKYKAFCSSYPAL